MLFAPLVFRSRTRSSVILTCYGFLILYGAWIFQDQGTSPAETFALSQRFMLVALPLFVVAYADAICALAGRLRLARAATPVVAAVAGLIALGLLSSSVGIQRTVQHHAQTLFDVRAALLRAVRPSDLLVCDKEVGKLLLPQWGHRDVYIVDNQSSASVASYIQTWEAQTGPAGRRAVVADWSDGGLDHARGPCPPNLRQLLPTPNLGPWR
jgi:hypothetical protein